MARLAATGLVVIALLLPGCARSEPQGSPVTLPAKETPQVSQLRAQVRGLRTLLDDVPVSYLAEPTTQFSDGTFEVIIDDVLTSATPPALVVDFVTPGSKPGTDSHYWNKFTRRQRVEVDSSAVVAIRDPEFELEIVSFEDFAAHWHAMDDRSTTGYWVNLDRGRVTQMWEVWVP